MAKSLSEEIYTIADIKAAHYAGWYNGLENAYRHEFSWSEYKKFLEEKLNKEQSPEKCDTTEADSNSSAGNKSLLEQ